MKSKAFHIGDILSISTGYLVSPRHMEGVYDILNFMTGDTLFTHQLPRAANECRPWLARQHPQLESANDWAAAAMATIPEDAPPAARKVIIDSFIAAAVERFGETLLIEPIPADDHERKDALTELRELMPNAQVIPVVVD
jgi:hypothetical protein